MGDLPEGRINMTFDWATLDPAPEWNCLDAHPNLVTSYSIQRGRSHELERTDTGRATIQIIDPTGILNLNDPASPYAGKVRPLVQAAIARRNPVSGEWTQRFRGFVEAFDYSAHPTQRMNMLTITLVDLFEILNAVEMYPGQVGDTPPPDSEGQVYFASETVDERILHALADFGLPSSYRVIFNGNVQLQPVVYSPGESIMTAITEAADGEGPPAVSNVFCDRKGRLCFRGRHASFHPVALAATTTPDLWDFHEWIAGDGAAVDALDGTVQIRELSYNRGLASILNSASATPMKIEDEDVAGQFVVDVPSTEFYGMRTWSASNLLTASSLADSADALTETRRFAQFVVDNYRDIRDRPRIAVRSLRPGDPRAAAVWSFLNTVDIGDIVHVRVASPATGVPTFNVGADGFFVEGIEEEVKPLTGDYDDVTVTLTLTTQDYYQFDPWPTPVLDGVAAAR